MPIAGKGPWVRGQEVLVECLVLRVNLIHELIAQNLQAAGSRFVGLELGAGRVRLDEDGGDRETRDDRRSADQEQDPVVGSHHLSLRTCPLHVSPPMGSHPPLFVPSEVGK